MADNLFNYDCFDAVHVINPKKENLKKAITYLHKLKGKKMLLVINDLSGALITGYFEWILKNKVIIKYPQYRDIFMFMQWTIQEVLKSHRVFSVGRAGWRRFGVSRGLWSGLRRGRRYVDCRSKKR